MVGGKMEAKVKSFMFYNNYYLLIKLLPKNEQEKIALSILKFMFENEEPNFKEDSQLYAVWTNVQMGLKTSKKNALNGLKGGAPIGNNNAEKTNQKQTKKQANKQPKEQPKKETRKQTNNISTFYFLLSNFYFLQDKRLLREKMKEWLDYKWERKEPYKEMGFKSLLTQVKNNTENFGEQAIVDLIDECMANNYKGIIFDKLKKKKRENVPSWFNKKNKVEKLTIEEQAEIEKSLNELI